jgi:hypothetical protein
VSKDKRREILIAGLAFLLLICLIAYEHWEKESCIRSGGEMGYPENTQNIVGEGSPVEECLPKSK